MTSSKLLANFIQRQFLSETLSIERTLDVDFARDLIIIIIIIIIPITTSHLSE